MKNKLLLQHGFTLIELAVVIALLTILALIVVPAHSNQETQQSVDNVLITDSK